MSLYKQPSGRYTLAADGAVGPNDPQLVLIGGGQVNGSRGDGWAQSGVSLNLDDVQGVEVGDEQSRYSSFCMLLATCMMAMGKLWDEAANTAEASDTSFLSRNSAVEREQDPTIQKTQPCSMRQTLTPRVKQNNTAACDWLVTAGSTWVQLGEHLTNDHQQFLLLFDDVDLKDRSQTRDREGRGQLGHNLNVTSGGGSRGAGQEGGGRGCVRVNSIRGGTKSQGGVEGTDVYSSRSTPCCLIPGQVKRINPKMIRHLEILTASASAFSREARPEATTDSMTATQRCLSGKLGAMKKIDCPGQQGA
ncbi:hypothetical protein INR49_016714 [Caranx melampygus]|nr:hypothetical protein INR49_016714 [Caranx melampygus]